MLQGLDLWGDPDLSRLFATLNSPCACGPKTSLALDFRAVTEPTVCAVAKLLLESAFQPC